MIKITVICVTRVELKYFWTIFVNQYNRLQKIV